MDFFDEVIIKYMHDPVDKCFQIPGHRQRAFQYFQNLAQFLQNPPGHQQGFELRYDCEDQIASAMERGLLPPNTAVHFQQRYIIVHPLSGIKKSLLLSNVNLQNLQQTLQNALNQIVQEIRGIIGTQKDPRFAFLYLWWYYEKKLREIGGNMKEYWEVLPADTRVPDHSIWHHLKATSALTCPEMYLVIVAIGPVQSFIQQSRKTIDFYASSYLISRLTFEAMKPIIEKYGPQCIIYPDLKDQPLMERYLYSREEGIGGVIRAEEAEMREYWDIPTIPNRFVALIPSDGLSEIKNIEKKLEDFLKEEIKKCVEREIELKNYPEVYWIALPIKLITFKKEEKEKIKELHDQIGKLSCLFDEDYLKDWETFLNWILSNAQFPPNTGVLYPLLYTAAEKGMGMRKQLRNFDFQKEDTYKNKTCIVCGERKAEGDEELCWLCYFKRNYARNKGIAFPSTASVAAADFIEKVEGKPEFQNYVQQLKKLGVKADTDRYLPRIKGKNCVNMEFFYEENLNDRRLEEETGREVKKEEITRLRESLKNLREKAGMLPTPYYALIKMDADDMKKWLSGEKLPDVLKVYHPDILNQFREIGWEYPEAFKKIGNGKRLLTPAIHSAISTALRNFAIEFVIKIIEKEHLGKVVYAGGDDLLAFVNLRDLFDVIHKLRLSFSGFCEINGNGEIELTKETDGYVEDEKEEKLILTMGPTSTLSCGAVIAHYKTPLKLVISQATQMLDYAKELEGKNACAIALMKHSGSIRITRFKFLETEINEEKAKINFDAMEIIKDVTEIFKEGEISKRFIYQLAEETKQIKDIKDKELLGTLLERMVKRHLKEEAKEDKNKIKELFKLYDYMRNFEEFINLLRVIVEVAERRSYGYSD